MRRKVLRYARRDRLGIAAEAMARIARLYAIEAEMRGRPRRQARAGPELGAMQAWLHATLPQPSKKNELAAAEDVGAFLRPSAFQDELC